MHHWATQTFVAVHHDAVSIVIMNAQILFNACSSVLFNFNSDLSKNISK